MSSDRATGPISRCGVFGWQSALLLGLLGLSVSRCGLNIGEPATENTVLRLDTKGLDCMNGVGEKVEKYFRAELSAAEVESFGDCVKNALIAFEYVAKGADAASYKPQEIVSFLHQNFLKDYQVSASFLTEVMQLKSTFFGGSNREITREQFRRIIDHADFVKQQLLRLRPYVPVYNLDLGKKWQAEGRQLPDIEAAHQALLDVANEYALFFAKGQRNFTIAMLESYFAEFRRFLKWDQVPSKIPARTPEAWANFLRAFKAVAAGAPADVVRPYEWQGLLRAGANWYMLVMRYQYQIMNQRVAYGKGLRHLEFLLRSGLQYASEAIDKHPHQVVPFELLDELTDTLGVLQLLPLGLQAEVVKPSIRVLATRVFGDPGLPSSQRRSSGVTHFVRWRVEEEVAQWLYVQKWINDRLLREAKNQNLQVASVGQALNPSQARTASSFSNQWDQQNPLENENHYKEMQEIINRIRPYFPPGQDRLFVVHPSEFEKFDLVKGNHDLTYKNTIRTVARLLIRGWSEDPNRGFSMGGVTEAELKQFFKDAIALGANLKFMDPNNPDTYRRVFLEGNLFNFSSKGFEHPRLKQKESDPEDVVDFYEAIELIAYVYSSGEIKKNWYREIIQICPVGEVDVFGFPRVERSCFERHFRAMVPTQLSNVPHMADYLTAKISDERWEKLATELWNMIKQKRRGELWVEESDFGAIGLMLQYIEALFVRFDLDANGELDYDELWAAYPHFGGALEREYVQNKLEVLESERVNGNLDEVEFEKKKAGLKLGPWFTKRIYQHIIYTRQPTDNLWRLVVEVGGSWIRENLKWFYGKSEFRLDRGGLIEVIGALSEASSEGNQEAEVLQ